MVYISRDGKVYQRQPWSLSRILSIILGFFYAIGFFLRSLIDPFTNPDGYTSGDSRRSFWRGSGGSSGGGSDDRGPPRPPTNGKNQSFI